MPLTLLPTRANYGLADPIRIEVRDADAPLDGTLTVWRLGELVHTQPLQPGPIQTLPDLAAGGYGIELDGPVGTARTAVEVTADPRARLRYGFVASYNPGRTLARSPTSPAGFT